MIKIETKVNFNAIYRHMNLPKTTELSLKTIVEGMGQISTKVGQPQPQQMTTEMKRQLKEMAAMFYEYGSVFEAEKKIMESAEAIAEFMKLAEMYAVNEGGDVFQENIIKNDFKDAAKKVQKIQELAKECYVKKQFLETLFDDVRHVVERYYKVSKPIPTPNTVISEGKRCRGCGEEFSSSELNKDGYCINCGETQEIYSEPSSH